VEKKEPGLEWGGVSKRQGDKKQGYVDLRTNMGKRRGTREKAKMPLLELGRNQLVLLKVRTDRGPLGRAGQLGRKSKQKGPKITL